ncbi:hypothetical protein SSYRP_v1c02740 [Spiroplasma syrphidicola EA-1]|uniref:Uncharacterized protein n=1 Tax=Spiroplasma syrphidicola EA-1 TaxID=1276229 RepID=R4UI89_9MOLU|nr:hypothetical protein [Spiroplasma syrphidicola]AGM25870.1 hypothetical protein SSYRP_v1c02740 [Spiroplasma syrphidicola EA-1]
MINKLEPKLIFSFGVNILNKEQKNTVNTNTSLLNELEILKNFLHSSLNVKIKLNEIVSKKGAQHYNFSFKKWFSSDKDLKFLRNNNFLEFNYFFSEEQQKNISSWLDLIRNIIADGYKKIIINDKEVQKYKEIGMEEIIIFLFIILKNQGKIKRIIKLINEFFLFTKIGDEDIEEINKLVFLTVKKNFGLNDDDHNKISVKKLKNLYLFNKDIIGKNNLPNKKIKKIETITNVLYAQIKTINNNVKSQKYFFEEIFNFELNDLKWNNMFHFSDVLIVWLNNYFGKQPKGENGRFVYKNILSTLEVRANFDEKETPRGNKKYINLFFKNKNNLKNNLLIKLENTRADILYLVLWLKVIGLSRLKFFLDFSQLEIDEKK